MQGARWLLFGLLALAACPPGAAAALGLRPCAGVTGFDCGVLRVPLDRSGAVPGTVGLRVAVRRGAGAGALVALTGGPGQGGVMAAEQFALTLRPLLRTRRLVVLDQRGTGGSGALDCPAVQRLSALDAFTPAAVRGCAQHVGRRRRAYTTRDTVADLEALRVALGVPRLALMGVSYGTFVAQQYARVHPDRTERLLLDSVVAGDGVDPFLLDTFSRMARVLREQCAGSRCRGITADPVADLAALVPRLAAGSVRGPILDARGRRRTASFRTGEELFFALIAADVNPYLQAALPGAIAAARNGDAAPLVRLRRIAAGVPGRREELSGGLNVVTSCQDVRLPYALSLPPAARPDAARAALAALAPASFAPWDAPTVLTSSYVEDCLGYPDAGTPPSTAPLPDVPTLALSGRLDLRTPLENVDVLAAERPGIERVSVAGTGHDVLDSDETRCVRRAVERWAAGRRVGDPCAGHTNAVAPLPRPPRALSSYRPAPGVAGDRGRVLFAVLDALQDARVSLLQRLYAGLPGVGGGLRSGAFSAPERLDHLRLADYSYLAGVRVSGRLTFAPDGLAGLLRVRAPRGLGGTLRLDGTRVVGRLGGRTVDYRETVARGARRVDATRRLAGSAMALSLPARPARRPRR